MIEIRFIPHKDLTDNLRDSICLFKNLNWVYPLESHKQWMNLHLRPQDIHLILLINEEWIAYMNIVELCVSLDGNCQPGLGIGNVCVDPKYKGKGYGKFLMSVAKDYAINRHQIAILICQDKNVKFYEACDWFKYNGQIVDKNPPIHLFSNLSISAHSIKFDRDF